MSTRLTRGLGQKMRSGGTPLVNILVTETLTAAMGDDLFAVAIDADTTDIAVTLVEVFTAEVTDADPTVSIDNQTITVENE